VEERRFLKSRHKDKYQGRSMDDKVMRIANKNTSKVGIKTKLVRRQRGKRNQWRDR
jgi:hypothetical protein